MIKKELNEYNLNVFNELGQKWGIVTGGSREIGFNCLTVSWGGFGVLWGKNVAYIFVRHSRHTFEFLEKTKNVSISFLSDEYKKAKGLIGTLSGRNCDKMKEAGLNYEYNETFDISYIKEAEYCFNMQTLYSIDLPIDSLDQAILDRYYPNGDIHRMYVCEIKEYISKK